MLSKFLVFSIVSLYVVSVTPSLAAMDEQINKRISYLQLQINQLRTQKKQTVHTTRHYRERACLNSKCVYHASCLRIGPYMNIKKACDGSELVVNIPEIREDARILLRQYQLEQECRHLGIPTPPLPRVTLSGKLEGQVTYGSTCAGLRDANVNFSGVGAGLDAYIQGNSWISGYMTLDRDLDWSLDGSRVFMNRAFITIGNLSRFPFYSSIGQVYIPFGRYNSLMISPPVTLGLGRTRAYAFSVGYQQTGDNTLRAEVYGYQGSAGSLSRSDQDNQWGADFGYEYNCSRINGAVGASFVSNLINSKMDKILHHTVQAVDFYGSFSIDPMVFIAEYVGALKSFDVIDISFVNQGARPTAFHTEASYAFHTSSKPSSIGIGYGHTTQALALGLPQDRYSVFYNVNILMDTNFALEYRHDVHYSRNSISTGINPTSPNIAADLGKTDNIVTAQFDLYF